MTSQGFCFLSVPCQGVLQKGQLGQDGSDQTNQAKRSTLGGVWHSRFGAVAFAVRVAVFVGRLRVRPVVVSPEVVTKLVNVREVRQAVCVHHRVAVLGEAGGRDTHCEPVHKSGVE